MEKLPMCRICLVENVRMFVVNRNLQELYEKLTDIPFVTEDSRPILACSFCCVKLKQCYRLLRKCLEAEEQFALMMNVDYEPNPSIKQDHLEWFSGFIKSPIEHINIDDECQIAVKEELPAVFEGLEDIIQPKAEHQSDELEPHNLHNSGLDVADIPPQHSGSDFEYDVPLIEYKTEVVEEDVSEKKRRASETERVTVAKIPKLNAQRTEMEDALTAEQTTKEKSDSKAIRKTQKLTSEPGTFKEPYKRDQHSFSENEDLKKHISVHTGEKPYKCVVCQRNFHRKSNLTYHSRIHTGEKRYKCDICQRNFLRKSHLTYHIRIHTGEKPYKCDLCQRSFSQRGDLTRHIHKHTGEKPYKCDLCQRSFSRNDDLSRHIRIHTGETPYKCDTCHRSFNQNSSLIKHIRIHSGEKPYKCEVCQRSFNHKSSLTNHIRIHTGE